MPALGITTPPPSVALLLTEARSLWSSFGPQLKEVVAGGDVAQGLMITKASQADRMTEAMDNVVLAYADLAAKG